MAATLPKALACVCLACVCVARVRPARIPPPKNHYGQLKTDKDNFQTPVKHQQLSKCVTKYPQTPHQCRRIVRSPEATAPRPASAALPGADSHAALRHTGSARARHGSAAQAEEAPRPSAAHFPFFHFLFFPLSLFLFPFLSFSSFPPRLSFPPARVRRPSASGATMSSTQVWSDRIHDRDGNHRP